jgi:hypothetical protein
MNNARDAINPKSANISGAMLNWYLGLVGRAYFHYTGARTFTGAYDKMCVPRL